MTTKNKNSYIQFDAVHCMAFLGQNIADIQCDQHK